MQTGYLLKYDADRVPHELLLLLEMITVDKPKKPVVKKKFGEPTVTLFPAKETFKGRRTVFRLLARLFCPALLAPAGDALQAAREEQLCEELRDPQVDVLALLEERLTLRTFLSGHQVSVCDVVAAGELKARGLAAQGTHTKRWAANLPFVREEAAQASGAKGGARVTTSSGRKLNLGWAGAFAKKIPLEDADKGVVTRFPPEPSGFLHVGHLKAVLLNGYFKDLYGGRLLVRFDDTNPKKEKDEFVEAILEDLARMEVKPDVVSYTSDHFDLILEHGLKLIQQGDAYVDTAPAEEIKAKRRAGEVTPDRANSVERNVELWKEMLAGSEVGAASVLRAKIDMKENNTALRDPALARCIIDTPHQRTGTKYKCYPVYDLACPIVDSHEGVTHAMRDSQYHQRIPLYNWVLDKLKLRRVHIKEFARINFVRTILSKRKLQWFVDQGLVSGWDDPALPTVRGILARGLSVEALRLFIVNQGASLSITNMSMNALWAVNKKVIDPVTPRYTAVEAGSCWEATLTGVEAVRKEVPLHPKKQYKIGTKEVLLAPLILMEAGDCERLAVGDEFTLMNWGNAVVTARDETARTLTLEPKFDGDFQATSIKASWVAKEGAVPLKLTKIGDLITSDFLPQDADFTTVVNPVLKSTTEFLAESAFTQVKPGVTVQFMRRGFWRLLKAGECVDVPDGKVTKEESVLVSK